MTAFKRPESVLVIIVAETSGRVLMLRRKDDPDFWQSVTGSLELNEKPYETACREIKEETAFDVKQNSLQDLSHSIIFEIFPHFRHRYAPNVTHCKEHWFKMVQSEEKMPLLTEHSEYRWLAPDEAASLTKSWSNSQAILEFAV
ncbi:dihydroneopterin triphosphate pyrophosphatase [Providencia rettgeri]|nr:dihydroneopterin triphosphate pyrophosphatase [Providencia rettgeri]